MANNLIAEYWISATQENLFQNNAFWNFAQDHSEWADNGVVHVPNAGALATYTENPTSYPLSVAPRTDNSLDYNINNYASQVWTIQDSEKIFIRYDKVKSMVYSMTEGLKQLLGNVTPYKWAAGVSGQASSIVFTSGSATASCLPTYAGNVATGTRNAPTLADIAKVKEVLDIQFVSEEGRHFLFPSVMWNNGILGLSNIIINQYYDMKTPVVPGGGTVPIFGFTTHIRPNVLYTDASGNLLTYNTSTGLPATPAATDCAAAIAWHPDYVSKAIGVIDLYYHAKRPEYQGDLMSIRVHYGASYLRSDLKGVVLLVMA